MSDTDASAARPTCLLREKSQLPLDLTFDIVSDSRIVSDATDDDDVRYNETVNAVDPSTPTMCKSGAAKFDILLKFFDSIDSVFRDSDRNSKLNDDDENRKHNAVMGCAASSSSPPPPFRVNPRYNVYLSFELFFNFSFFFSGLDGKVCCGATWVFKEGGGGKSRPVSRRATGPSVFI